MRHGQIELKMSLVRCSDQSGGTSENRLKRSELFCGLFIARYSIIIDCVSHYTIVKRKVAIID